MHSFPVDSTIGGAHKRREIRSAISARLSMLCFLGSGSRLEQRTDRPTNVRNRIRVYNFEIDQHLTLRVPDASHAKVADRSPSSPPPCGRTTGSGVTWPKPIEANCPATSRISLCLRITLPPLGQLRPWSSENPFPQPSQVLGRRSRDLLKRMANPSRNSSADKTVLFFSLGMADSQAPVEKSLALMAQRSKRPPRADTHVSNFVGSFFSRLSRATWRALVTDSWCLPGSNSSFPVMVFTRWMVALRDTLYATGADVDGFVTPRPVILIGSWHSFRSAGLTSQPNSFGSYPSAIAFSTD